MLRQARSAVGSTRDSATILSFVREALGLRFEMRFEWESSWWPIDAQEVAETLAGYHVSLPQCLENLRAGRTVSSGLAYFRLRH